MLSMLKVSRSPRCWQFVVVLLSAAIGERRNKRFANKFGATTRTAQFRHESLTRCLLVVPAGTARRGQR